MAIDPEEIVGTVVPSDQRGGVICTGTRCA